jgi:hypothetical protein
LHRHLRPISLRRQLAREEFACGLTGERANKRSVTPASREADEAKRSGLTEPWTAGQSRVVVAVVHAAELLVGELARRSRRAGGREAGAAIVGRAGQDSEQGRAHPE